MNIFLIVLATIIAVGIGAILGGFVVLLNRNSVASSIESRGLGSSPRSFRTELLVDAVNSNKNGLFICSAEGHMVFVNKSFCEMLGYSIDEMLLLTFQDITPPEFDEQDKYFLNKSVNGVLDTFELRKNYFHKNKRQLPVIIQVSTLRNSSGDVTFFIANVQRDIITEKNIVVNHRYFESAFVNSNIGMAIVGLDGSWIRVNGALCTLLGYTEPEFLRKTFQEITVPEDLPTDLDNMQKVLHRVIDTYTLKKRYIHKDGSIIPTVLFVSGVYDTISGEVASFVSQIQIDPTDNQ
jgi:PAS domain S-box-containing protein